MGDKEMVHLTNINGLGVYIADNSFEKPGLWYWDGKRNIHPVSEIDRLKRELEEAKYVITRREKEVELAVNAKNKAQAELARYKSKYHNLLAVAHRDEGHYLQDHGEEKAGEDAITAILTAYHDNDRYRAGVEVEGSVGTDIFGHKYVIFDLDDTFEHQQQVRCLVKEVRDE